MSVEVQEGVD